MHHYNFNGFDRTVTGVTGQRQKSIASRQTEVPDFKGGGGERLAMVAEIMATG
jgi:hypothetical protein